MIARQTGAILRYLRGLVDAETNQNLSDTQLLQNFTEQHEEAAFAALVQRHGALVWGVCQHVLHHEHDAEDAFQATFLVLARRAGSIRKSEAVGSFLHSVAYRIALRAKQIAKKRRAGEVQSVRPSPEQPPDRFAWRELQAMLDEEVARLPVKYRSPFVLCCLEGKSRADAAQELRCKEGTVSSRIARARQLLQQRLAARGVTLSAALCAAVLWKQTAAATVPALLASSTVQFVSRAAGRFSTAATTLAENALRAMGFRRWCLGGMLILGVSLLAAGAGIGRYVAVAPPETLPKEAPASSAEIRKDRYGDPLPPKALARLGTVRQRAPDSHLAVTADGKEIVAVNNDLTVRRFDAQTGELRLIRQLAKASGAFQWLTWLSPRGSVALAVKFKGEPGQPIKCYLDLWDLEKGKSEQELSVAAAVYLGTAFSPDERRVAVLDFSQSQRTQRLLLWDLRTSQSRVLWSEMKKDQAFYSEPVAVFSPDGKRLVSCHLDQFLRCWEVESGKLLWQSEKKLSSPFIIFSADGWTLITPWGIGTNDIDIRDAATGKLLETKKTPKEALVPIGCSPDGKFLAFQTGKEEVILWEPGKEKVTFRSPRPPHRRDDPIHFLPSQLPTNFVFTPDSKGIIRRAGALQRWDLSTGESVYSDTDGWGHTENVTGLLFSPDGKLLASSSKDQTVRLWDVSAACTVHRFSKHDSDHLAFTPDGRYLLTVPYFVLRGSILQARDVASGRPGRTFGLADHPKEWTSIRGKELHLTADGNKIRMLDWKFGKSILMIWNAETGACLVNKDVPLSSKESLLTPDGKSALDTNSSTGAIWFLDLETGKPRWQLKVERTLAPSERIRECGLALSPDGRLMAAHRSFYNRANSHMDYESILLADMSTGRQLAKLPTDGPAVFDFSADSRVLAVAGSAGICLWETATWKEVGFIPVPHRDARPPDRACASSLAFSPDGRILATGHADGTILLWDPTLRVGQNREPLSAAQREVLWNDLAESDAAKAYAAIGRLADDAVASVSFLKDRLKPVSPVPPDVLRSLLAELDSDRFAVREAAQQKLRVLGERIASSLHAELKTKPSLEKRRRLEEVLACLDQSRPIAGELLRGLRAVQVLERIGSTEARQLLDKLNQGVESARLTEAANEALMRLKKR